jgi:hypothetical protein
MIEWKQIESVVIVRYYCVLRYVETVQISTFDAEQPVLNSYFYTYTSKNNLSGVG